MRRAATIAISFRPQSPPLIRLGQPPVGDHADAFPRLSVVGDTREHQRSSITAES
jgi:hypothetical protein